MASSMSVVSALRPLVECELQELNATLAFVPNPKRKGKVCPDFDFVYERNGRPITERGLAMSVQSRLGFKGHAYMMSTVLSVMTGLAWENFEQSNLPPTGEAL